MDFKKVSIAFIGALAAGALFTACPGAEGTLYGECSSDLACSTGEICHPDAGVCVTSCTDANDCGDEAKTCAAVSDADERTVCQCQTDELCAGFAEGLACAIDQGAVCKGDGTGGNPDEGTLGQACEGDAQSTCDYGQFCDTTCTAAPQATDACENFDSKGIEWTPESGTGGVIYSVSRIAGGVAAYDCEQADQVKFSTKVLAYLPADSDAVFPNTRQQLGNFFYVKVNGDEVDAGIWLMKDAQYRISNDGKNGEFDLTVCAPAGSTQVQMGLYFVGGNEVCHVAN